MSEIVERQSLLRMEKFESVFQTISEQITLQTKMLADMVEISMDQLKINQETKEREKARQQREDLADAQEEDRDEPADVSPDRSESSREGPGLFSMLGGMGLSKLLIGGALLGGGLFAAYNIAKGFIDEMYNDAWSKFEDGLVNLVNSIDWDGLKESLSKLPEAVENFADFLNNPITYILGAAAGTILTSLAGGVAMRTLFGPRQGGLLNPSRAAAPTRSFGNFNPDGTVRGGAQSARPGARPAPTPGAPATPRAPTGGGRGSYGMDTPEGRAQIRRDAAASRPGRFRLDSQGRLQRPGGGGFASDAEALDALQKSLDPKYSKVFGRLIKLFSLIKIAFAVYLAYEIYSILSDTNLSDDEKMQRMAPILGSLLGGLGGAAIGAAIGSIPPGTGWGTLLLGIAGGIAGSLAGEQLGYYVAKWAFSEEPTTEERRVMVSERERLAGQFDEFTPFREDLSTVAPSPATVGTGVTSVPPRPTVAGHTGRTARQRWDDQYGATHNADGTPRASGVPEYARGTRGFQDFGPASFAILHGREAVVPEETPAGRFLTQFSNEDWSPKMSGASGVAEQVSAVASGGVNMPVIVHNSPTVAPIINNVQGGANISTTSVYGSGGGDRSRNTYGLTNSAN